MDKNKKVILGIMLGIFIVIGFALIMRTSTPYSWQYSTICSYYNSDNPTKWEIEHYEFAKSKIAFYGLGYYGGVTLLLAGVFGFIYSIVTTLKVEYKINKKRICETIPMNMFKKIERLLFLVIIIFTLFGKWGGVYKIGKAYLGKGSLFQLNLIFTLLIIVCSILASWFVNKNEMEKLAITSALQLIIIRYCSYHIKGTGIICEWGQIHSLLVVISFIIAIILYINPIDEETTRKMEKKMKLGSLNENNINIDISSVSSADELKKFKELLDSGVITQEEFEAKKKQLLNL